MSFRTCAFAHSLDRFVLLAPRSATFASGLFSDWTTDARTHDNHLAAMQRLRGRVYLEDGAITTDDLDETCRHRLSGDERSWHFLAMDTNGEVQGCVRSLPNPATVKFEELSLHRSALAQSDRWGSQLRQAVESELERSRFLNVDFFEVGGWAFSRKLRCTRAAVSAALGAYALAQHLGGGIGVATATVRNHSSAILKRIGGRALRAGSQELPAYFDPQYGCTMEVLSFDLERPREGVARQIESIRNLLPSIPVVCPVSPAAWSPALTAVASTPQHA